MNERTMLELIREAYDAADFRMVDVCLDALDGDEPSIAEVKRVIEEAKEAAR